jgi:hypothetical protein
MGGDQDMSCESCGFKALTPYLLRLLAGMLFFGFEWPGTKKKRKQCLEIDIPYHHQVVEWSSTVVYIMYILYHCTTAYIHKLNCIARKMIGLAYLDLDPPTTYRYRILDTYKRTWFHLPIKKWEFDQIFMGINGGSNGIYTGLCLQLCVTWGLRGGVLIVLPWPLRTTQLIPRPIPPFQMLSFDRKFN